VNLGSWQVDLDVIQTPDQFKTQNAVTEHETQDAHSNS